MIISVDFDGTCVTHDFPEVGKDIGAEIVLGELYRAGHDIICMTMRSQKNKEKWNIDTVNDAKNWFKKHNIRLFGFNENPEQESWSDSRKIYAHTYIDDQFLGCPLMLNEKYGNRVFVDWYNVTILLTRQGIIKPRICDKILDKLTKEYPDLYKQY